MDALSSIYPLVLLAHLFVAGVGVYRVMSAIDQDDIVAGFGFMLFGGSMAALTLWNMTT